MKKYVIAAVIMIAAMPAFALDLHSARAAGSVKELPTGYIAAVTPSAEVNALVASVNAERKAEYERIGKEKGQSADVVGKIIAPTIAKNAAGN